MEKMYNTLKKYVAGAIVAGALALGSGVARGGELPTVMPETRESMQSIVEEYKGLEQGVVEKYNAAIADRNFSMEEQRKVYVEIGNLRNYAETHSIKGSHKISNLEDGLSENLNGVDWGKPELEKSFEANGLEVKVERVTSGREVLEGLGTAVSLAAIGITASIVYSKKR